MGIRLPLAKITNVSLAKQPEDDDDDDDDDEELELLPCAPSIINRLVRTKYCHTCMSKNYLMFGWLRCRLSN